MVPHPKLISIIIPVYNCECYLAEAIESALAQTYRPTEIIVINDGSTDNSGSVAQKFLPAIRYYAHVNIGLGATRNRGAEMAKGQYLAFLDSDDMWLPNKLERQISLFDDGLNLDMAFGYVQQFISPELEAESKNKIAHSADIMQGPIAGTLLIKRESFFRAGIFETDWKVGEFIDWFLKARERNLKNAILPEVVMKRRLHNANMGIREQKHQGDYLHILKASLERKRKSERMKQALSADQS